MIAVVACVRHTHTDAYHTSVAGRQAGRDGDTGSPSTLFIRLNFLWQMRESAIHIFFYELTNIFTELFVAAAVVPHALSHSHTHPTDQTGKTHILSV